MRKVLALVSLASMLALSGCTDLKLANERVREDNAGQQGYDVTHQVTERQEAYQSGATGAAVSEVNTGTAPNPGKTNPEAGSLTAVPNTSLMEVTGEKPTPKNGVPIGNQKTETKQSR
jgi:hypothetical protein